MTQSGLQVPPDFLDSSGRALNYTVIAQSAAEVRRVENAPAVGMAKFLVDSRQLELLPTISIYAERGEDRVTVRMLYMNAVALQIWREMGMRTTEIGMQHRPSRTAILVFGMPFSE